MTVFGSGFKLYNRIVVHKYIRFDSFFLMDEILFTINMNNNEQRE